jgi:hypothetical protein
MQTFYFANVSDFWYPPYTFIYIDSSLPNFFPQSSKLWASQNILFPPSLLTAFDACPSMPKELSLLWHFAPPLPATPLPMPPCHNQNYFFKRLTHHHALYLAHWPHHRTLLPQLSYHHSSDIGTIKRLNCAVLPIMARSEPNLTRLYTLSLEAFRTLFTATHKLVVCRQTSKSTKENVTQTGIFKLLTYLIY